MSKFQMNSPWVTKDVFAEDLFFKVQCTANIEGVLHGYKTALLESVGKVVTKTMRRCENISAGW